ncbi:MAG: biotin/lipoyl-containing protein, partial [Ilumatobacteraceae bacterium]
VEGVATTIPADLAILRHADFQSMQHSTKWVEERLDLSAITPPAPPAASADADGAPLVQRATTVEVNGKRFAVTMWVPDTPSVAAPAAKAGARKPARSGGGSSGAVGSSSGEVTVPMQGTIVKVLVEVGQAVEAGQAVVVLEAMKMENQIEADKSGTIKAINVKPGDTVGAGDVVAVIG